ncbi:MAG: hypothetical protein LH477_12280 [Nocardioides sp.]|nr:hypothetical protein [Nocardioides sp.]
MHAPVAAATTPAVPLLYRLGVHHVWRTASTEDGRRYRRCARCGKDHPGTGNGPGDWFASGGM